eukprot:403369465
MEKHKWFLDSLESFQATYPKQFHLPCHSGRYTDQRFKDAEQRIGSKKIDGSWFGLYDVEDLALKDGRLNDLGANYHDAFNSSLTLFLQNGSTLGNQVLCMAFAKKKVLVQSNSHVSVYIGLQNAGATLIILQPEFDLEYGIFQPINAKQIQDILQNHPDLDAVYLTSPNHEGLACNYEEIRQAIGDYIMLIIDEAHGSHFYFKKDLKCKAALNQNMRCIDAAVTSIHKNLGGLSATALINLSYGSRLENEQIIDIYNMVSTTSPSPYLLLDTECCVRKFQEDGEEMITQAIQLNSRFREQISSIDFVKVVNYPDQDPTKTVLRITGIDGESLYKLLDQNRINVEKYSKTSVLITIHININEQDVEDLIEAVKLISKLYGSEELIRDKKYLAQQEYINLSLKRLLQNRVFKMDIRDVMASKTEKIKCSQAIGKISAEMKSKSPPGYPILLYGEIIQDEHIQFLGGDEMIKVVREV